MRKKFRLVQDDDRPARMECHVCHKEFPFTSDFFVVSRNMKWGLRYSCLDCNREYQARQRILKTQPEVTVPPIMPGDTNIHYMCSTCSRCKQPLEFVFERDNRGNVRNVLGAVMTARGWVHENEKDCHPAENTQG